MKWVMFLILLVAPLAQAVELKQSRELQNLWVRAGFQIGVDRSPAWSWYAMTEPLYEVFIIESPEHYYPPAVINVRYNKYHPPQVAATFKTTAYFVLLNLQKKLGATVDFTYSDISPASYGELTGFEQVSRVYIDGAAYSNRAFVGLNAAQKMMVLNAVTLETKAEHLHPALKRMWGNISFLNSSAKPRQKD